MLYFGGKIEYMFRRNSALELFNQNIPPKKQDIVGRKEPWN